MNRSYPPLSLDDGGYFFLVFFRNPLQYRDGMTMTWTNGRQLSTLTKGGATSSYSYDTNGNRTKKVANGVTTEYYLNEGTIVAEKRGSDVIRYLFDENGGRYGFELNGAKYYYVFNGQGDVVAIANAIANEIARYTYDSWGRLLSVKDYQGNDKSGDPTFAGVAITESAYPEILSYSVKSAGGSPIML